MKINILIKDRDVRYKTSISTFIFKFKEEYKMKIWKEEQLKLLEGYPKEIVDNVNEKIGILNDNYGTDRGVDKDLGGYIQVIESLEELKSLKGGILHGLVEEYSDEICTTENGDVYNSTLYIASSDYNVVVITKNEMIDELLK